MTGKRPGMANERPRYNGMQWLNIILQGVLIGGLYAMFAAGLSLIFGVMRLVNIDHGDLIVLAAYIALMVTQALDVSPMTSLLLVVPAMAVIGYTLQRGLLNRTLGDDLLPPLLVTFGLSIMIQNGLLELFTADSRKLQAGAIEVQAFQLMQDVWIGILPLIQFVVAIGVIAGLETLFYRTALGRAFRATIHRWRNWWVSTRVTSLPWRWPCRSRLSLSQACFLPFVPISIPRLALPG
jgi:branched-chain amino acid transport system permease protein